MNIRNKKVIGPVTKAESIKADTQRRINPTAEGAEKKSKKDRKN
jgi:hypothetical protein